MFLVTGITGQVGGATARHLLADGHIIRALVRDPAKAAAWTEQGVELHQSDFNDVDALAAAMQGVEGVFLMLPPFFTPAPGFPEAKAMADGFRAAVLVTRPKRVVALSSVGAQQTSGLGMITAVHHLEESLGDLPLSVCFVRAGSFLENYSRSIDRAALSGVFDTYLVPTNQAYPMIATDDIGKEIAHRLNTQMAQRKIVALGSMISSNDLAQAMSEVAGTSIKAKAVPRGQWTASLEAQGMPADFIEPFLEMEDGYNSGWIAFGVDDAERVSSTITPARVFAQARKLSRSGRSNPPALL